MTLREALISSLCAAALCGTAQAASGDQGPHRGLIIGGDCMECSFEGANLAGAQFLGGNFSGANFASAELLRARLIDLNLNGARFREASLTEAHFANSELIGVDLEDAELDRARFHQTRMQNATLRDITMEEAVFSVADLAGADLNDVEASSSVFRQVSFVGASVRDGVFANAHFNRAQFAGANLRRASFSGAIVENVDFTGADLRDVNFEDARLIRVNFTGADLRGASGLTNQSLNLACGANVRGLPESISLEPCMAAVVAAAEPRALSVAINGRETRLAQIEIAREAVEAALAEVQVEVGGSERVRLEALAEAQEGWQALAEAFAEAESEIAEAAAEVEWTFEIRRAELGEPIRVILEQANPERVFVMRPGQAMPAPPPSPPAPELPRPAGTELLGGDDRAAPEPRERRSALIVREGSYSTAIRLSAADIGLLISATVSEFSSTPDAQGIEFRNVQAGVWNSEGQGNRSLLCGEVELDATGNGVQWERFTTVRRGRFDVIVGDASEAICQGDDVHFMPSGDLGIRIERGIDQATE